jgi:hypothetical protein
MNPEPEGEKTMKISRFLCFLMLFALISGSGSIVLGEEPLFKEYDVLVIKDLEVTSNIPAPDSAGSQIAEKVVFQVRRYSQKYSLFDAIVKEGKEVSSGKKMLLVTGTVKEYTQPTLGRRIGRSLIPGGGFTGSAAFAAHYQFIDQETGKVIYETDLRSTSTGSNDTVDYAMERNGEALAKIITKYKGK